VILPIRGGAIGRAIDGGFSSFVLLEAGAAEKRDDERSSAEFVIGDNWSAVLKRCAAHHQRPARRRQGPERIGAHGPPRLSVPYPATARRKRSTSASSL